MKLNIKTDGLEKLSVHDRIGVLGASKWPFTTLSEWDANLAERFETPNQPDYDHGWRVVRDDHSVWLRHHVFLVVLTISEA